jgi:starch phosphorylase
VNAVSALHEEVARKMWHNLWPQVPADEVPIGHVTNGIHVRSWLSPDISYVLERYLSSRWFTRPADQSVWEGVMQIPDEELWRAHERCRSLGAWLETEPRERLIAARYDEVAAPMKCSIPKLTIGFARRFASYSARVPAAIRIACARYWRTPRRRSSRLRRQGTRPTARARS